MVRLRSSNYPEEDFPIAPMIDMVFLLLVFFMTVGSLARGSFREVNLPESAEAKVPESMDDRGTVTLAADGGIFVGGAERSLEEMQAIIRAEVQRNPRIQLYLRAHEQTQYGDIRRVLDACAEAGAYQIIYAAHQL
jgi:biopolymer transport protein ExbD